MIEIKQAGFLHMNNQCCFRQEFGVVRQLKKLQVSIHWNSNGFNAVLLFKYQYIDVSLLGPLSSYGLILILVWVCNCIHYKVSKRIRENNWSLRILSNFIPHFTVCTEYLSMLRLDLIHISTRDHWWASNTIISCSWKGTGACIFSL